MEIRAKVVIIATGGFAANVEMRKEYNPSLVDLPTTNSPAIVGDGIKMAQEVGANLIGRNIHLYHLETPRMVL